MCEKHQMRLLTIESTAELDFISDTLLVYKQTTRGYSDVHFWTAGKKETDDYTYKWIQGNQVDDWISGWDWDCCGDKYLQLQLKTSVNSKVELKKEAYISGKLVVPVCEAFLPSTC